MPKKKLTDLTVKKLKPPPQGKQIDYYDTGQPGLVLRINYGGAKVWRALHYRKRPGKDGKVVNIPTTATLGKYPDLTVVAARDAFRKFDPQQAKAEAEIAKQAASAASFAAVAEEFIKRYVERKRLRTQGEIERLLDKLVLPVWGNKPFREIRRSDVTALLDGIEDGGHGARQADYVLAIIRKLCNWYAEREDDYVSPVPRSLEPRAANAARTRTLNDDEIRKLWIACADQGTFGAMLKMLVLTAARRAKVMTMKWEDVKDDVWTIASLPREKPNAGSLTLPKMALDIIAAQPQLGDSPYIFAGSGGGIFNTFSQSKAELDAALSIPPWRVHDLRRTSKTLMQAAGVMPHISERVLGHTIEGVEGVYDQHDYAKEKADALARLAAKIESIVNPPPGNVLAFPQAAVLVS